MEADFACTLRAVCNIIATMRGELYEKQTVSDSNPAKISLITTCYFEYPQLSNAL